jgi:hypothetical protein
MLAHTSLNERTSFLFLGTTVLVASIVLRESKHGFFSRSLPLSVLLLGEWLLCSNPGRNSVVANEEHRDHRNNLVGPVTSSFHGSKMKRPNDQSDSSIWELTLAAPPNT